MPSYRGVNTSGVSARVQYNAITEVLAPEYRDLDAEDIYELFEQMDIDADLLEGFWSGLRKFAKKISRVVPQVLPVAGTVVGGIYGGPAGAALGGKIGGMAGGVVSGSIKPSQLGSHTMGMVGSMGRSQLGLPSWISLPQSSEAQSPSDSNMPNFAQQTAIPTGSPAAVKLLQLIFRPETLDALMAMSMGPMGAPNIRIGSEKVPPSAITNLISLLAREATLEYNAMDRAIRPYREHEDVAGEKIEDPAEAIPRATKLLQELQEVEL